VLKPDARTFWVARQEPAPGESRKDSEARVHDHARACPWYHATNMSPVTQLVSNTLSHRDAIVAAWVFGSTERGRTGPSSEAAETEPRA